MLNPRFQHLPAHTWTQLRTLLDGLPAGRNQPLDLTIGEPRHPMPAFITDVLEANRDGYAKYPPIQGTPDWQRAVAGWLERRYGLSGIEPDRHVLPVSGTREGLFGVAFVAVPEVKAGQRPLVLMPNPFYQCYAAAALAAGADPVYLPATAETGFLPAFAGLDEAILSRAALIYLCTPANPQGTVADQAYFDALIPLCRRHDITLVVDECYGEIYTGAPPTGALEACRSLAERGLGDRAAPYANVLSFQSLSKRSNVPGLRSGFVAGDPRLIAAYRELRSYGGAPSPLPVYAAAAAAWSDEAHVEENRGLYRAKFDAAERILDGRFGAYRPGGGFYLWLDVGDGESAARTLWSRAGVRVLPGAYLSRPDGSGYNPGAAYVRVALVNSLEVTELALQSIRDTLGDEAGT
ncbi:MAG: aminotransferase class I/II-fold pyridoxal phosphate-dependent enzyme [Alphaproteobacteria bacterium]|nr:aminotransferase class I/II-fold pyridoxal phosphate-dependent enzyme [Alphaproteobacteria bacterium]